MAASSRTAPGRGRNWAELPDDVTASILLRLGAIEILTSAQMVCVTWRDICKDPLTWRTIDMRVDPDDQRHIGYDLEKMCRHAVDRSSGNLIDMNVDHFGTDELLKYITDSSRGIKRLRLAHCYDITNEGLSEAASKLPLLEDLEISYCLFSHEPLEVVGASCPLLKSFKFNKRWCTWPDEESNDDALAIAGTMHDLRHLQLLGNNLTNDGLRAILDRCPHLESLDLRRCSKLKLGGKSGTRCVERIKKLWLPDDPIDNSELVHADSDYGSYDEDNPSAFSDVDLMFDDEEEYEFSYMNDNEDYDMDDYDVYPWLAPSLSCDLTTPSGSTAPEAFQRNRKSHYGTQLRRID